MWLLVKSYLSTLLFISAALFLTLASSAIEVAYALFGLAGVQLLNRAALWLPKHLARSIYWMHALTFELFALLGVALLRFTPFRSKAIGKGKPILLVHGYINHSSVWTLQKK